LGSLDSFDVTEGGKIAAQLIINFLDSGNADSLVNAFNIYNELIPNENFGGEYTAFQWLCTLLLSGDASKAELMKRADVASWYDLLAQNDFENLREYITYKYHFAEYPDDEVRRKVRFLEDFILFSNPDRSRWENTYEKLPLLGINVGETVIDCGAASGFFTFKFCEAVGPTGKIWAVETNPMHLNYLTNFVINNNITNVEIVRANVNDIGLSPDVKADVLFMCSLFHVLYASLMEHERDSYIQSIKNALLPGGRLIIVDNDLVESSELPYHGPYMDKSLVISQLYHYGFRLVDAFHFTLQRYALTFKLDETLTPIIYKEPKKGTVIPVYSHSSLVHYRIADAAITAGYSPNGQEAAALLLDALMLSGSERVSALKRVMEVYERLIPKDRIGDEYTALVWFCKCVINETPLDQLVTNELDQMFYNTFAPDDFDMLKRYVNSKYALNRPLPPLDNLPAVSEYITFNNPNRELWEHTREMLDFIGIKPGMSVADIGCGSGFFSYHFARDVGDKGIVYATETNKEALAYVERFAREFGMNNITPVIGRLNDCCVPGKSVDVVFMCSMYHAVYIASLEFVKDQFIDSIKRALKPGGRLIITDNDVVFGGIPPYYGSAISKELVIEQLLAYGWRFIAQQQLIPQRYTLIFEPGKTS
jgi:predicted methyltransferase